MNIMNIERRLSSITKLPVQVKEYNSSIHIVFGELDIMESMQRVSEDVMVYYLTNKIKDEVLKDYVKRVNTIVG